VREYLFDDKDSIIHFILGAITPFILPIGFLVYFVFLIYEVLEPENPVSTLGDVIEYHSGLLFALLMQLYIYIQTHNFLLFIKM
jgi:hypothetical protein